MQGVSLIAIVAIIFGLNFLFTRWFIRYAKVKRITDYPVERSSHSNPTPRGGGVGFVFFILGSFLVLGGLNFVKMGSGLFLFAGLLATISLIGWLDDKKDLSRKFRFGIQFISALAVLLFISGFTEFSLPFIAPFHLGFFGIVIGIVWLTGVTNIYNFMDGVDGLSSVQAIGAALGWSLFFYLNEEPLLISMSLSVVAGVSAFLFFNWPSAKIFMGDVGSLFLGFLFGAFPFYAASISEEITVSFAIWIAALLLWPFLFDGAFTIVRRLINGENIFEAHRSHLYQRLNIIGWGHKKVTLLYSFFIVLSILCSFLFSTGNEWIQLFSILFLLIGSFGFAWYVHLLEKSAKG